MPNYKKQRSNSESDNASWPKYREPNGA